MSDIPANDRDRLDLREQVTRIDEMISRIERQQEETRKFVSEQHKLMAEARKYSRDPWFLVIGAIIAGMFTRLPEILRALGFGG